MSVHKYPEPLVLAVDFNPKRLIWDEGEVSGGRLLLRPLPRHTCITQELAVTEASGEFQGHVIQRLLLLRVTAAGQTDVKAVWLQVDNTHHYDLLPWTHAAPDASTERHRQQA